MRWSRRRTMRMSQYVALYFFASRSATAPNFSRSPGGVFEVAGAPNRLAAKAEVEAARKCLRVSILVVSLLKVLQEGARLQVQATGNSISITREVGSGIGSPSSSKPSMWYSIASRMFNSTSAGFFPSRRSRASRERRRNNCADPFQSRPRTSS